jgi:hypothetical protein
MKHRKPLDFHLSCNCFLQVQKGLNAQGIRILGLMMWSDKGGNSGLAIPILKRLLNPDGTPQKGMIHLDFCPFCGTQIAVRPIRIAKDETDTESKPNP